MSVPPPSLTPPTLQPFQFSYGGLVFGGVGAGLAYQLLKADGLDLPAVQMSDPRRSRDEGAWIGLPLIDARTIVVDIIILPDGTGTGLSHAKAALAAVLIPQGAIKSSEFPLWMNFPNVGTLAVMARPTKMAYTLGQERIAPSADHGGLVRGATTDRGWQPCSIQFSCTDPRVYSAPSTTTTIASGSTVAITNAGDIEMRPVLVITGPCTNPTIANTTLGATLTFTGTVASGATLTIDLDSHFVTLTSGGVTSVVANWLTPGSIWWNLPPGANNIHFAGGGSLAVQWASAYGTALG